MGRGTLDDTKKEAHHGRWVLRGWRHQQRKIAPLFSREEKRNNDAGIFLNPRVVCAAWEEENVPGESHSCLKVADEEVGVTRRKKTYKGKRREVRRGVVFHQRDVHPQKKLKPEAGRCQ